MTQMISVDVDVAVPPAEVPPPLKPGEAFHVFISYSSTDYQWTHALIERLESAGLRVCYHERDFTAGRTVLENMSECIQESQKVLLVLSSEFVRSRWCLLEANMSLFRDCLERKPLVPVLLDPGVCVPLHLCHLTYLEVRDPEFEGKLLKVLCTPNRQLQGSTVVPYQPPSIYNGKALQPLTAANVESLYKWDAGQFSDTDIPDQLRLILADPEKYREAVRIVNNVSSNRVWMRSLCDRVLGYFMGVLFFVILTGVFGYSTANVIVFFSPVQINNSPAVMCSIIIIAFSSVPIGLLVQLSLWKHDDENYVGCKGQFAATFDDSDNAEKLLKLALLWFSTEYACCLAKRCYPFPLPCPPPGHLEGGVCFCQYVSMQLSLGEWK
ncbi:uncharacterized protein LOC144071464 isoform X2 [Stigmatopora argus]